jgi:cytochrome c5
MTPRLTMALAAALVLVAAGAAVAQGPNDVLPDGPGKDVVVRVCTGCHEASQIAEKPRTPQDWEYVIGKMIDGGAELTAEEQDAVYAYLVKAFPKPAPAPVPAPAPPGR